MYTVCRRMDNCATKGSLMARGFVPTEFDHPRSQMLSYALAAALERQAILLNFDASLFRTAACELCEKFCANLKREISHSEKRPSRTPREEKRNTAGGTALAPLLLGLSAHHMGRK